VAEPLQARDDGVTEREQDGARQQAKEVTVKRTIALIITAAALAAIVASAPVSAGTPADKRVVVLEQQVKALQAQVKALKTQVTVVRKTVDSNQNDVRNGFARQRVGDACLAIAVADVFQSTWTNVDQRVPAGPAFGSQQDFGDVACNPIGITPPGVQTHPTVGAFWSLVGWLIG
jgi:outer membrane murein-binding lipoprotein Lpp